MEVLKFEEAEPATFPTLNEKGAGGSVQDIIEPDPNLWMRIEEYIVYRWTSRQAVWTVAGPGDWFPHLTPISSVTVDAWDDVTLTWSSVIPEATPLDGLYLNQHKTYRITGTVGANAGEVPQMVIEAYQRLKRYCADQFEVDIPAAVTGYSFLGEPIGAKPVMANYGQTTIDRSAAWMAKAMQYSGAADLLRKYRRL
jgi:hypothetical protein